MLEHAGIDWRKAPAGPSSVPVWQIVTPAGALDMEAKDTKFFKSIKDEVDDASKKSSLLMMLQHLQFAVCQERYQEYLQGTPVQVKSAYSFKMHSSKHHVWELKYQNKDRLYFFTHSIDKQGGPQLALLQFHHKKDQNTPEHVKTYAEKTMKPFIEPKATVQFTKGKS